MEAQLCRGDPVVAVGGGNSAGQATLFLAQYVPRVSLVLREHELGESMSRYLADRISHHPSVEVLTGCEVCEAMGDGRLEALIVEETETGVRHRIEARALFVFIGAEPHTEWLRGQVALDSGGYVLSGQDAAVANRSIRVMVRVGLRCCWIPASRVCSQPATSAAAPRSASPPRSAMVRS